MSYKTAAMNFKEFFNFKNKIRDGSSPFQSGLTFVGKGGGGDNSLSDH